jgi:hypothetical protein
MSEGMSRRNLFATVGLTAVGAMGAVAMGSRGSVAMAAVGSPRARPVRTASFGPNGTHWPEDTPWLDEAVPHVINVACSWSAIKAALLSVTDAQAAAGVHILVAPGELVGLGGGASGRAVLADVGSTTWRRRVLVSPQNGYGSVKIVGAVKLKKVMGVAFALLFGDHITMMMCNRSALCWSSLDGWLVYGAAGGPGSITENCDLYEVVVDRPQLRSVDPTGFGAGYTQSSGGPADGNGWLRNCLIVGCYTAPRWRIAGASDHVDTCQLFGGGGIYYGFTFRDTAIWGSNNCALQTGTLTNEQLQYLPTEVPPHISLDHTLLVGPVTTQATRYPAMIGGTPVSLNQAINGSGGALGMIAQNSIVAGSIYPSQWHLVTDTQVPSLRTGVRVSMGGWTVNPELKTPPVTYFDALSPRPTEAFLRSIWMP